MRAWVYATVGPVPRQLIFHIDDVGFQFAKLESTYNRKTPQAVDPEAPNNTITSEAAVIHFNDWKEMKFSPEMEATGFIISWMTAWRQAERNMSSGTLTPMVEFYLFLDAVRDHPSMADYAEDIHVVVAGKPTVPPIDSAIAYFLLHSTLEHL